jgi:multidrug efflux pump subunit AcrA (membrane-fusion protein)
LLERFEFAVQNYLKITVGEVIGSANVEIINGLKIGDRVVVAGAGYLKDGDKVQVVQGK